MNTQTDTANPPNNGNGTRRRRLLIVAAIVVIALGAYGAYWFLHGRYFESTDDAYVSSDLVQISSEVAGAVTSVHVDDTQHVERGQILVELDPAYAEVGAASAQAELARSRSEEHTSELQSLMRISYAVFCLKKKTYRHR